MNNANNNITVTIQRTGLSPRTGEVLKGRGDAWEWIVAREGMRVFSGYCRTKRYCLNDSGIFAALAEKRQESWGFLAKSEEAK